MKRIVVFLLTAVLALSFAGCGLLNKKPSESDPVTDNPDTTQSGGTQEVTVENKVNLSLDKTKYDREERIEVTLDFGKLNKDSAVIVITASDTAHGNETAVHEDAAHEEYRWLVDFTELPFYMWAPNKDGLFDVRVYANGDGGEELASITFAVGNAVLPNATGEPDESGKSLWFIDEVLAEMKLIGFTQPEGYEVLTDEELPDHMENDPYFRVIKGSPNMDGYFPTIDKVYGLLRAAYGEVYTWIYSYDDYKYHWGTELTYGSEPFYVWDGDTILSVSFTFSGSWDGVDGEVLQIRLNPNADDPRNDY